jgi:hypothetical protein
VVEARTRLVAADGRTLDDVSTYTAHLRWGIVPTGGERRMGRIVLGGSPLYLRGVMNQGYDPQGGMTATHDELTRTYGLMREFGLNLARIHQTVPSAEECEIALRSGILLGIEPPAPRETSRRAMRRTATCWADIARTLAGTPAVALAFVTNETWGVELKTVPGYAVGSPDAEQQRILAEEFPEGFADAVEAQYDRLVGTTLTYFADRLISVSDGWQFRLGRVPLPVLGQHDYQPPALLRERYATGPLVDRLLQGVEPDRELLPPDVDVSLLARTAVILSEMGGRRVETGDGEVLERDPLYLPADPTAPATWAYGTLSPDQYAAEVRAAFAVACSGELSGGVLTQWRDVVIYYLSADGDLLTGGEYNGLLYADGMPKVPGLRVSVG